MKTDRTVIPAAILQRHNNLRSTLLLFLLCITIVWPASLQSLFQSLSPNEFFASHTVSATQSTAKSAISAGDSHAVDNYAWTPDPSDNQSALTQTSQVVAGSILRPSDPNSRRHLNATDASTSSDAQNSGSGSHDAPDGTSSFFSDNVLPPHAADILPALCLQSRAREPWLVPARLPSHRGLVRFALAPPTFC